MNTWLAMTIMILNSFIVSADDFEVDGVFYRIISEMDLTVEVVPSSNGEYSGKVVIPENIVWNEKKYSVTSIASNTFNNCLINTLIIGANILKIDKGQSEPYKTIWLTNTPPEGCRYLCGKVNYVSNYQFEDVNNKYVYKHLSSMFEVDGVVYVPVNPSERNCDVISSNYDRAITNIIIEETVSYKNVSMSVERIMPYAFCLNNDIKNVVLKNNGNVEYCAFFLCKEMQEATVLNKGDIGTGTFSTCRGLQKVTVSNEGNIGEYVFQECTGLQEATISNNGDIGKYAFSHCNGLQKVQISNNGNIEKSSFSGCSTLEKANISNNGYIGDNAFSTCPMLQNVTLGNNITSLGYEAFYKCENLQEIIVPDFVKSIGEYCFRYCSVMKKAIIGNGVKYIGEQSFEYCKALEEVVIGDSVTSIKDWTFNGCSALKNIKIGGNVVTIGEYAFNFCSALPEIIIPQSVNTIDDYAFSGCTGLKKVIIEERKGTLSLGSNGASPLFSSCPLDYVYIGRNITYFKSAYKGYSPFYRNTSLREVVVTDEEIEISENEFYGCTNLKNVTIGNGVKSIGNYAFSCCSALEGFSFGSSMENIGDEAFSDCINLTQIISSAATPPTCGTQALDDIIKWNCTLKVPMESLTEYQQAEQWKDFFFIEGTETGIGNISSNRPSDGKCDVYGADGRLIRRNANVRSLKKGLYIINGKKVLVK